MNFEQNHNSADSNSLNHLRILPETSAGQLHQGSEQRTYYSPVSVANESPRQCFTSISNTSGTSPSNSVVADSTSLSTANLSAYLSCAGVLDFARVSPSRFTATSPTRPPNASPPYIIRGSPSHFSRTSPSGFSGASPPRFSDTNTLGFSSASSPDPSSSDSRANSQSADLDDLGIAVALRNLEIETNQRNGFPLYENSNPQCESRERSSPYTVPLRAYDNQVFPTTQTDVSRASSIWRTTNVPPMDLSSYCPSNIHGYDQGQYCLTCSQPFCESCSSDSHNNHTYVNYVEFLERAVVQARKTMNEVQLEWSIIQSELDDVLMDIDMLAQKAREAGDEVMRYTRKLLIAVERREKELLGIIENARMANFTALKTKGEHLRNDKIRLTRAASKLHSALDSCTLASNPRDLLAIKDMTVAEMFQINQNRRQLSVREENWISFAYPGDNLINAIQSVGNVVTSNPGPIGQGRAIYGSNTSQSHLSYVSTRTPSKMAARNRPAPATTAVVPPPVVVAEHPQETGSSKVIRAIGDDGDTADNLCRPWGITCDNRGHIIVADRSNNRIQIYREDGTFVRKFGSQGTGPCQFDRPAGVAVDTWQRIIVADKDNHRIQILQMDGTFVHSFGQKGFRSGSFNYPWDVAVNSKCQIAVSDTRNHRVQLFNPDGVFMFKYGYDSTPSMWKHFDSPRGVCFTPEGDLITTDFNNHHLVIIDSRFSNARLIMCESADGSNRPFLRPQGLVVDRNGNIIVADSRNHRIQVFDSTGRFLWKYGTHGTGIDEMDRPAGVALLPNGKIAIVDFGNNRVLLLEHRNE